MPIYFHIDICYLCCRVEYVSRGVLQIIREAPNGTLWVSEEEKPLYQVIIPSRHSLRAEWTIFWKIHLLTGRILGNWALHLLPKRQKIKKTRVKTLVYNYNWPFMLWKSNSYLVMGSGKQKMCSNYVHCSSAIKLVLAECINLTFLDQLISM